MKTELPKYRILVCGPRDFPSYFRVYCVVMPILLRIFVEAKGNPVIVHGGANGVDKMAGRVAGRLGFSEEIFKAQWDKHGKSAGFKRNEEMIRSKPDLVIAIGYGKGTAHTIKLAQKAEIPLLLKSQWWIGASAR